MKHNPAFVRLVEEARGHVQECSVQFVKQQLEEGVPCFVVDVREDHEVVSGMVPGAIHLGRGILERDIESTIRDQLATVILYCGGGYRSVLAAENVQKMGYTHVWSMEGGIKAWNDAGYSLTVKSPEASISHDPRD
jgi:rhodanese-related sulfurtransferase